MNTITNYCRFIGKLVDDPKVVDFETTSLCTLTLAINEYRKEKNGEKKKVVNYFDFEAWDSGGMAIYTHCAKGDLIDLAASARNNSWVDKKGDKRYATKFRVTEFKILSNKKETRSA